MGMLSRSGGGFPFPFEDRLKVGLLVIFGGGLDKSGWSFKFEILGRLSSRPHPLGPFRKLFLVNLSQYPICKRE